jgi:ribosomal protein L20A (L18A)
MRFPNAREVERACFFGKYMKMKVCDAAFNVASWYDAIGAKHRLHKSWVKVHNIRMEKRCDEHAAYVGSLVDVTLKVIMNLFTKLSIA